MAAGVIQAGDPILRGVARAVDAADLASIVELIEALRAGLEQTPGVGLAAPQIGVARRVVLVQDPASFQARVSEARLAELERTPVEPYVLINPEIEAIGTQRRTFFEGCLSVDGYCALVERSRSVRVRWLDPSGACHSETVHGWHARILQHEVDHLNGILYIDRMFTRSFMSMERYGDWAHQPLEVVRAAFGVA